MTKSRSHKGEMTKGEARNKTRLLWRPGKFERNEHYSKQNKARPEGSRPQICSERELEGKVSDGRRDLGKKYGGQESRLSFPKKNSE